MWIIKTHMEQFHHALDVHLYVEKKALSIASFLQEHT